MFRLEVIDFYDPSNQALVARVPESGSAAIKFGAQLIVQQSQVAVFFRDGRAMDQFGPGRHTLTTANLPIIGQILALPFEKSPFQAAVYFVGQQTFLDQRWGTRQPITLRDKDFGIVRLRGFGKFSYRVKDPTLLINSVVGTQGRLTTAEVVDYLRDQIVAVLTDVFATAAIPLLDMPARMDELSIAARVQTAERFKTLGLELVEILISSITPPSEVQKAIDAKSSMTVLGDLNSYTMYQTGRGLEAAGKSSDGNLGLGMAMVLPSMVQQAMKAAATSTPTNVAAPSTFQPSSNTQQPEQQRVAPEKVLEAITELAKQLQWKVQDSRDNKMTLRIDLSPLRRQIVMVETGLSDERGYGVVRIWSVCGPINPASAALLLRSNDEIIHGALALRRIGDAEQLVIRSNLLTDTLDLPELSRTIAAIAWQADQMESQLSQGEDLN